MILVYAISLGISAGVTGLFVRQALSEQGYVPGLTPGLMLACGAAASYAAIQLLYVALVRLAWPTKTNGPLLGECLSHGTVVLFLPYLAHVNVRWPHPALESFESILYVFAFLAAHTAMKLAGFYAILRSETGPRAWNLAWAAAALPLLLAGYVFFDTWASSVEKARPRAAEEVRNYRVGTTYANARALPEGSILTLNSNASIGACLMLACANPPDIPPEETLEAAYFTVEMYGETTTQFSAPVVLDDTSWSYLQIPSDQLPRKLSSCRVRWSTEKESKWRRALGVLPVLTSGRSLLVEGPDVHELQSDEEPPNVVIIVVDGLGSDRVSSMGSARATTPNLDRIGQSSLTFPFTYTPAPEAAAACMTLLTGVSPLRHGYLGEQRGPLPKECTTLAEALRAGRYATAAFTEGEAWGDLAHASGFERGFDYFDDGYIADAAAVIAPGDQPVANSPAGSQETLRRAAQWIDAHKDVKHMVFVRLGELRDTRARDRHGRASAADPASATSAANYTAIIQYMDRSIGEFAAHARDAVPNKKTCIVITSTRGSYMPDTTVLADWSLRVPFILSSPGVLAAKRSELAALEDIPSTLAKLTRVTLSPYASTADLVNAPVSREPISMAGNPLLLSIRNAKMRLLWSTQREPFTQRSAALPAAAALYDLTKVRAGVPMQDISSKNPDTTRKWTEKLESYITMQSEGWQPGAAE